MEREVGYKRLLQSSYKASRRGGGLAFPRCADGCRHVSGDGPADRAANQAARMATVRLQNVPRILRIDADWRAITAKRRNDVSIDGGKDRSGYRDGRLKFVG